jgi:hypothetical protein
MTQIVQGYEQQSHGKILDFQSALASRNFINRLSHFLTVELDNTKISAFVDTLSDEGKLFFFDDPANEVIDHEGRLMFSEKECVLVELVLNRIRGDADLYLYLLKEAFGCEAA